MEGKATLVNLNPTLNSWYLLLLQWADGHEGAYHLVNVHPAIQDLVLDPGNPSGITIVDTQSKRACDLLSDEARPTLELAATSTSPYVSLCGDEVVLRLKTPGRRTTLEWATDFLRDNVWGGEKITVFVRQSFFQDAYLSTSDLVLGAAGTPVVAEGAEAPRSAALSGEVASALLHPKSSGSRSKARSRDRSPRAAGTACSSIPASSPASCVQTSSTRKSFAPSARSSSRLDDVEREALVYLVAFDLDQLRPRLRSRHRAPARRLVRARARRIARPGASRPGRHRRHRAARARPASSRGPMPTVRSRPSPAASSATTAPSASPSSRPATTAATTASSRAARS